MRRMTILVVLLVLATSMTWAGETKPFHILLVNDDGVDAPGLEALAVVLHADPAYRVTVVAPTDHQSGKGSALTYQGEIAVRPHGSVGGAPAVSVDATPATTTRIGLAFVLEEDPPDLVVSGINRGENVGRIAWYSGTVGAAREAVLAGSTAVAFSLQLNWADPQPNFKDAARWAKPVVDALRSQPLPRGVYLNVNIPKDPASIRGYRLCRQGLERPQVAGFDLKREEDGVRYLKSRWAPAMGNGTGSDTAALHRGWVTLTPLSLDATAYRVLPELTTLFDLKAPQEKEGEASLKP
ncbi:MAG: 5'/3'-nucleotidase SurE [Acidobacteria bacterium]|nr:5'/3'-nucleotidase SurE [Acidobacteriota bacterium]